MKKIFLLSLLSVLILSAFSQISSSNIEILAKINITRIAEDAIDEDGADDNFDDLYLAPWWPRWWFLYKEVRTEVFPGGAIVYCLGNGWHWCSIRLRDVINVSSVRGVDSETIDATYQDMIEKSEEQAAGGEYQGSITKKIAYPDPDRDGKESYLLFQMKWDYDPINPYNGKAEIIISKTDNLGF